MPPVAIFQGGLIDIVALLTQQFALMGLSECYEFLDGMLRFPTRYGRNPGIVGGSFGVDVERRDGQGNEGRESKQLTDLRSY